MAANLFRRQIADPLPAAPEPSGRTAPRRSLTCALPLLLLAGLLTMAAFGRCIMDPQPGPGQVTSDSIGPISDIWTPVDYQAPDMGASDTGGSADATESDAGLSDAAPIDALDELQALPDGQDEADTPCLSAETF